MDSFIVNSIIAIAEKYSNVLKVWLFGSRARGDNHEKSDYDIAILAPMLSEKDKLGFLEDLENIETFHKIDVVFVRESNKELNENIERDGILLMDKFHIKLKNFSSALERLKEAVFENEKNQNTVLRDGAIQRFEFTAELSWKTTREYLLTLQINDINNPKAVMAEAYNNNLIDNEEKWLQILKDRNSTSHIYDEETADEIYSRIKNSHIDAFDSLVEVLGKK